MLFVRRAAHGGARGVALFLGTFTLVNSLAALAGSTLTEDLWWVDLRWLSPSAAGFILSASSVMLLGYAALPSMSEVRRRITVSITVLLAASAVVNTVTFYRAWNAGSIDPGAPVPLSAFVAVLLYGVALAAWRSDAADEQTRGVNAAMIAAALALVLLFPLGQVLSFGRTDYRRPADVAVVLGARVMPSGTLSVSLEDRVRTSVDLYREGYVERIIMSGGIADGIDEAQAMRNRAIAMGVPPSAVLTDSAGYNTDATVFNTSEMIAEGERILVVSQFYHLPRIKLAYRAAGREVYTVPATESWPIRKTPLFVAREIPGFWTYWARAVGRDLLGS